MKEFKPAFWFLFIFIAIYVGLNTLYGLWISSYGNQVDQATLLVTNHTSWLLNGFGEATQAQRNEATPTASIVIDSRVALNVFEGCNSMNVMIVFVAFLFAFKGSWKSMSWFLPLGLLIIYLANLARVVLLYYVAEYWQQYFYYVHKYAFTAIIYLIVFILWWWWIEKISGFSLKKVVTPDKP